MMMSQSYTPFAAGYQPIDAVRTDLNRLFYGEIRPEAVGHLPVSIAGWPLQSYGYPLAAQTWGQAYLPQYAQPYYQPFAQPYFQAPYQNFHPEYQAWNWDPRFAADPRLVESRVGDVRVDPRWVSQYSNGQIYSSLCPVANLAETPDAHLIVVELPGVDLRDVSLQCVGSQLILTAFRKPIWTNGTVTVGYQAIEGRFGTLRRVFHLPAGYPTPQLQASFMAGQLTIVLPKAAVPMGTTMTGTNVPINASIPTGV